VALGSGLIGYMVTRLGWLLRILLVAAGLGLIKPGIYSDLFGAVILVGTYLYQRRKGKEGTAMSSQAPGSPS